MSSDSTSSALKERLQVFKQPGLRYALNSIGHGIEKESLRITAEGRLAQTPHPQSLGSALTHSSITTDYSEALLEFITPVSHSIKESLNTLEDIHSYVYQQLGEDMLWSASMPCVISRDEDVPVAQYGSSNVARMKTVYRHGLGHRYGRKMQAIAGIHYNFSMPEDYWYYSWKEAGKPGDIASYISDRYLGLIRNFRRYSWLLIYLFGASPAVCASFLKGREDHQLQSFDETGKSLYLPYATALRMGGLGYNSDAQKDLKICYNSLDSYVETLTRAIMQPHSDYAQYSCGEEGNYQQLNDSLLQIENEFYSPIRPKRVAYSGETPLNALRRAGIEYIEVRCVDVSPFSAVGMDEQQARFLDTFLIYCLLSDSPECDEAEQTLQASNMEAVVNRGREPGLLLSNCNGEISLTDWSTQLLQEMEAIAAQLDSSHNCSEYSRALQQQQRCVDDPELTPSARVLREMRERKLPFFRLGMAYSEQWAEHFRARQLTPDTAEAMQREAARSLQAQRDIEAADKISFEQYLKEFYAQYSSL